MGKLAAILKLTRIEHSIMLVVAVIAAELLAGGLPNIQILIISLMAPIFVSMSAFAINDYFDVEVDKMNRKKDRPLVSGVMTRKEAIAISVACAIIGIISAIALNIYCFIIALAFALISFIYSLRLKETLLFGNAYVALSMAIPFIFGSYVVSSNLKLSIVLVALMIFLSGLGREIQGTIRDFRGDTSVRKARTLPSHVGLKASAALALFLYALAIFISMYLYIFVAPFAGDVAYATLILISDTMLTVTALGYFIYFNKEFYERARNLSLAAMMLALIGIILAVFF